MTARWTRLHRDPSRGWVAGVCTGLADHVGISDILVRAGWVAVTLFGAWQVSVLAYVVLALFLPVRSARLSSADEQSAVHLERSKALHEMDMSLRDAEQRVARLEAAVLSEEFRLGRAFSRMR